MEGTKTVSGGAKKEKSLLTSGNLIAYWRKRRQGKPNSPLSQQELAKLTGISTATLRQYESGKTIPPTKRLFAIASALEIPPHIVMAPMWRTMQKKMRQRRKQLGYGKAVM